MSAFQIIYFHATQVERRSGLCNAFSSLLYFSVLVIARLNGRYYIGGSGSKPGQKKKKKKKKRRRRNVWKKRARGSTVGELISVACFSVTAVLLPLWLKLRTMKLISAASGTVHTKAPSSRLCVNDDFRWQHKYSGSLWVACRHTNTPPHTHPHTQANSHCS